MASGTNTLVWEAVLTTAGFEAGLRSIGSGIQGILGTVQSVSSGITSTLSAAFNAVINIVRTIASTISSLLGAAFGVVTGIVQAFIGVVTGGFGAIGELISSIAGVVTGLLAGAFNILSSIVTGVFDVLQTAAQAAFQILTSIATISFEALVVGIMAVVGALGYLAVTGTKAYGNIEDAATDTANRISAVTGKSTGDVKKQYFEMAEAISKKTKFTAEDVGTSMPMLIARAMEKNPSATANQIAETLLPVAKFAEAIHRPLADAVNIANTTMKQFQIPFEDTGKTVDTLAQGFLTSQMSAQEYADTIQTLGQFAAAAGVPLDTLLSQVSDLSTIMQPAQITMGLRMAYTKQREFTKDLTEQQSKVAEAQDKYNTSLDKYNEKISAGKQATAPTPSDVLRQAGKLDFAKTPGEILDDLGFSVDDLKTKYKDAGAMYGEVIQREKDMHRSDLEIMGDFDKLIGGGARGGGLAAYNLGLEQLNGNLARSKTNIDNSKGSVDKYAASWDENLNTALEQTGKSISGVGDKIGKVLGPKLTDALNNTVIPIINTIGDAVGKAMSGDWTGFVDAINNMIDTAKSQLTYQKAYDFGKWIMDQIVAGVKGVGGIHWGTLWDTLKTSFVGAMEGIRKSIYDNFGVDIAEIYNSWRNAFMGIADVVISTMETVGEVVIRTAYAIVSILQWAMGQDYGTVLSNGFNAAGEAIVIIITTVAAEIYNILVTAVGGAIDAINSKLSGIGLSITPGTSSGLTSSNAMINQGLNPELGANKDATLPNLTSKGGWIDQQVNQYTPFDWGPYITGNTAGMTESQKAAKAQKNAPVVNGLATQYDAKTGYYFNRYGQAYTADKQYMGVDESKDQSAGAMEAGSTGSSTTSSGGVPTLPGYTSTPITATQKAVQEVHQEQSGTRTIGTGTGESQGFQGGLIGTGSYGNQHNIFSSILADAMSSMGPNGLIDIPDLISKVHEDWKAQFPLGKAKDGGDFAQEFMDTLNSGYTTKADPAVAQWTSSMEGLRTELKNALPEWTSSIDQSTSTTNSAVDSINKNLASLINGMDDNTAATNSNTNATDLQSGATKDNTKGTGDTMHAQNVGYNALQDALSGCTETMSKFGQWQEGNADLFYGSYLGDSAGYPAYQAQETNRRIQAANASAASGAVMLGSIQQYVGMTPIEVSVTGDTSELTNSANTATADIAGMNPVMQIGGDNSGAIQAGYDAVATISSMLATISIDAGGGYGAGGATPESTYGSADVMGNLSALISGEYQHGTDFVPYDQIAKLHRGEAVVTAEENKMADKGIFQLTYAPTTVIGTRTDKAEVERMVREMQDKHTQDIEKLLTNKIKGNR